MRNVELAFKVSAVVIFASLATVACSSSGVHETDGGAGSSGAAGVNGAAGGGGRVGGTAGASPDGGNCGDAMTKKANGAACGCPGECSSGFCADGVCCNVPCSGGCVSCGLPGRLGTCWPIDQGVPDPRAVCVDKGAPSCGTTGTCDGFGGCEKYAAETQCLAPSCTGTRGVSASRVRPSSPRSRVIYL